MFQVGGHELGQPLLAYRPEQVEGDRFEDLTEVVAGGVVPAVGVALLVSIFATQGGHTAATFVDGLNPALVTASAIVAAGMVLAGLLPGVRRAHR